MAGHLTIFRGDFQIVCKSPLRSSFRTLNQLYLKVWTQFFPNIRNRDDPVAIALSSRGPGFDACQSKTAIHANGMQNDAYEIRRGGHTTIYLHAPGARKKIRCGCKILQVPIHNIPPIIPLLVPKRGSHPLRGGSKLRWQVSGLPCGMNPRPSATAP